MSFSFGGELEDFNGFQWISALKWPDSYMNPMPRKFPCVECWPMHLSRWCCVIWCLCYWGFAKAWRSGLNTST
jgi:hypothetical protein